MQRSHLMTQLYHRANDLPFDVVEQCVRLLLGRIEEAIIKGERVEIRGFGAFSLTARAASTMRNPKTGELVQKKPRYAIRFVAGKELKQRVQSGSSVD